MKTIISDEKEIFYSAANKIKELLVEKPEAVLALVGGRSVQGLYSRLLQMYEAGELNFSKARAFAVAEFVESKESISCGKTIFDDFLDKTDMADENKCLPSPEHPENYDKLIAGCGGIDIAILGIGENAHIGYNEPATPFSSLTHVQKLTDATKRQLEKRLNAADTLPESAVTMGIRTITQAKNIIVLAFGEEKAQAVHKMLYGRNDSVVPAAFLQIPMNVTVYLDEAASSEI